MKYMLDTNICIYTIKQKPEAVIKNCCIKVSCWKVYCFIFEFRYCSGVTPYLALNAVWKWDWLEKHR